MGIECSIAGIRLKNPTVLASGILGMSPEILSRVADSGAGAVTMKSFTYEPRDGHKSPKVIVWDSGIANCYGLTNQGIGHLKEELPLLSEIKAPVFASIAGESVDDFREMAEKLSSYDNNKIIRLIELNLSCPNTTKHGSVFGLDKDVAFEVVSKVKDAVDVPVAAKLTPQAVNIAEIAKACEDAGADAITAINTLGPGMLIDIDFAKPVLSFKKGGLSGPAIKPVAVRCVYDIFENVEIPIIGTGGITTGKDAVEMLMAGASAVGIGSAVYYRGINVFEKVSAELGQWMDENGYSSIKSLVGVAHG